MALGHALRGRRVLVVGASRGIGAAIAVHAANEGAHVAVSARTRAPAPDRVGSLDEVAETIGAMGGRAVCVPADITREEDVDAMIASAGVALGGLDAVVITSAALSLTPATDTAVDRWQRVIDTTLTGPWLVARAALPVLARSEAGLLVAFSTVGVDMVDLGANAYWVAKSGLERLIAGLDAEWGSRGVRCCCIRPTGVVLTEGWARAGGGLDVPPEMIESMEHVTAMVGRLLADPRPPASIITTDLYDHEGR